MNQDLQNPKLIKNFRKFIDHASFLNQEFLKHFIQVSFRTLMKAMKVSQNHFVNFSTNIN